MPIWALTAERLDKLNHAIALKKGEHEDLLAKSEKDLWCADLDEFMAEWNAQIALEAELQTQIRRMGRRVSKKIGAGRSRKAKGDDDYAPEKKPRGKAKTVAATTTATAKAAPKVKVETKSAQRFAEMFSSKTKKEPKGDVVDLSDNFSDDDFMALSRSKPAAAPTTEPVQSQSASQSQSQSQSEEAEIMRPTKRAAASKAKTLFDVSSDSEDDDDDLLLGDIGSMVKGMPKSATDDAGRVGLHTMNRPESSHGNAGSSTLQRPKTKPSKSAMDMDSHDETNYELLAKSSPRKTATKDLDGQEQIDSDDELVTQVAKAVVAKADSGLAPVKKARAKPAASKAKAEPRKPRAAPKATTLSPAAKAYAAKKKIQGVKASAQQIDSDDDDDDDEHDELDEPSSPVSKPKPAARGRPGRAAAAKRPVIVDEDSSEMQEESDDPFEMSDI